MYDTRTKKYSLILTYSANYDYNKNIETIKSRKPQINKTKYLYNDYLFKKINNFNNINPTYFSESILRYGKPYPLYDKNEYIKLFKKYNGLKISESLFNSLKKLYNYNDIQDINEYRLGRFLTEGPLFIFNKKTQKIGIFKFGVNKKITAGDYVVAVNFLINDKKCIEHIKKENEYKKYMKQFFIYEKELR